MKLEKRIERSTEMEKEIRTSLWVENGIRLRTYISDFDKTGGNDWKRSFYELWRYQMTWDFAYEIKVHEVHDGDVCVSILARNAFEKQLLDTMEYLGYRNIKTSKENVGIVQLYDIDDPATENMYTVFAD